MSPPKVRTYFDDSGLLEQIRVDLKALEWQLSSSFVEKKPLLIDQVDAFEEEKETLKGKYDRQEIDGITYGEELKFLADAIKATKLFVVNSKGVSNKLITEEYYDDETPIKEDFLKDTKESYRQTVKALSWGEKIQIIRNQPRI